MIEMPKHSSGIAMKSPSRLVPFIFISVAKRLSQRDIRRQAWLVRQWGLIKRYAVDAGIILEEFVVEQRVGRKKTFTDGNLFERACAKANACGAGLVVGGIAELLSRTKHDLIDHATAGLDSLKVELWDATTGRCWSSLSAREKKSITAGAKFISQGRSMSIKQGLELTHRKRMPPPAENRLKGSRMNSLQANKRAEDLSAFVHALQAKLESGMTLSPVHLASALNEDGVPAARGGQWSFNAAKNLIRRIDRAVKL